MIRLSVFWINLINRVGVDSLGPFDFHRSRHPQAHSGAKPSVRARPITVMISLDICLAVIWQQDEIIATGIRSMLSGDPMHDRSHSIKNGFLPRLFRSATAGSILDHRHGFVAAGDGCWLGRVPADTSAPQIVDRRSVQVGSVLENRHGC
jgi:hypothetical protein